MRRLTLFMLLFCCICLNAQQRNESEAIQIAQEFFGKKGRASKLSVVSHQEIASQVCQKVAGARQAKSQCQGFYVVNDEANNRFVIVSADERMYNILGYSYNGLFEADSLPHGLMDILYGYEIQYSHLLGSTNTSHNYKVKTRVSKVVEPLIKTQWDQGSPYNDQCPEEKVLGIMDMRTVTGCVATAMAQVMNYHQYPTQGQSYTSYTTGSNISQAMDFSLISFDWENMSDTYDNSTPDVQKSAVAELMHACGVSVHMDYSWLESGAYAQDIAYALINYFKYNPNIKYYERRYFSKDDWDDIIQEDLANGRPILYSGMGEGKNSDGTTYKYGHQFVLDGCNSDGMYHFNFGWSGRYDGYFELTAVTPGDDHNYTLDQSMVCNISPQTVGKHEDIFFATAVLYDKLEINVGDNTTASFDPLCASIETNSYGAKFNGEFGIGVFDMDKNFVKSLYKRTENRMSIGSCYEGLKATLFFDQKTFTDGATYYIAPYAKSNSSSEYTWMRTTYGLWDYYVATVNNGVVTLGRNPLPIPTGRVYASAFDINNSKKEWQFTLTQDPDDKRVYWFDGIDPSIKGSDNSIKGTLDDSGTQIHISIGQIIGNDFTITNFSSPGDILVSVSAKDSVMNIEGAWGTLKMNEDGDDISLEPYSQYSLTEMTFKYVPIVAPAIIYNKTNQTVSIACSTDGASIYYTTDGTQPTSSANVYTTPIPVFGNCTIKAVAIKNGEQSDVSELAIKEFKVEKPAISVTDETFVTIDCATNDADIYYTTDGSSPASSSTRVKYVSTFRVDSSCTIKGIGVKDGYYDSEIVERYVIGPIPPSDTIVVNDNIAGQLEDRVGPTRKTAIKGLFVSGQLNSNDIAFIREMIINYNLSVLNIANANIVSGGDPYYKTTYLEYSTEDDVIGPDMFYQCKKLSSITLPLSAKSVKMFAFSNCESLTSLYIPCQCIEVMAIQNCKNLEVLQLASTVQQFDGDNITGCPKLGAITVDNDNPYFTDINGVLFTKDGTRLVKYPMGKEDQSYVIPNTVTTISKYAFSYAQISSVSVPFSVTLIEPSAFSNCVNLSNIDIPNSVQSIGYMAFFGCRNLTSVSLPSELTKIESMVFYDCINLREFTIGKNITTIASDAFENCSTLQKFNAVDNNSKFTTENGILYSKDMTILVRCPLAYYSDEFRLPDDVTIIGDDAFKGCKSIGKFVLPETIEEIGHSAFLGCTMTSINMPNNISKIGYMAFWGCNNLETFTIPEKITEIDDYLLYDCKKLYYLEIPENVKRISSMAFSGCESLKTIKCSVVDVNQLHVDISYDGLYHAFDRVPYDCDWIVPEESDYLYRVQPWWVQTWNGIENVQNHAFDISWENGILYLYTDRRGVVNIYSLNGMLVQCVKAEAGKKYQVKLPHGTYIINKRKVSFR